MNRTARVLGIHIIGPLATELLAEAATVLNLEGTIDDMMNMMHAHPTCGKRWAMRLPRFVACRSTCSCVLLVFSCPFSVKKLDEVFLIFFLTAN